ncbi:hypothetical protein NQD34_007464 [Periophthalmus magnuspinnatus]|nr:hypothetical protein NQD34_007464 [Periophthalmus magnuspinnatus]
MFPSCVSHSVFFKGVDVLKQLGFCGTWAGLVSSGSGSDGVAPCRCGVLLTAQTQVQAPLNAVIPAPFSLNSLSLVFTLSAHRIHSAFLFTVLSKERKMQFGVQLGPGGVSVHVGERSLVSFNYDVYDGQWHHLSVNIEGQLVSLLTPCGKKNMFLKLDSEIVEPMDPDGFFVLGDNNYSASPFEGAICQFDIYPSANATQNSDYVNEQCRQADTFQPLFSPGLPLDTDTNITEVLTELSRDYTFITQRSRTTAVSTDYTKMLITTFIHEDVDSLATTSGTVSSVDHEGSDMSLKHDAPQTQNDKPGNRVKDGQRKDTTLQSAFSAAPKDKTVFETSTTSSPIFVTDKIQPENTICLNGANGQEARATPSWLSSTPAADDSQTLNVEPTQVSLLVGPPGLRGEPGRPVISLSVVFQGPSGSYGRPGPTGAPGIKVIITLTLQIHIFKLFFRVKSRCSCDVTCFQGDLGSPGEPGQTGFQGDKGVLGSPGSKGPSGKPGPKVFLKMIIFLSKGFPGDIGPSGLNGRQGLKVSGHEGLSGGAGEPGLQGNPVSDLMIHVKKFHFGVSLFKPVGDDFDILLLVLKQGPPGPRGWRGVKGLKGIMGEQGLDGESGSKGPDGLKGENGLSGSEGEKGDPGETGLKGKEGTPGPLGLVGVRGQEGKPGTIGEKGKPGLKGRQGYQGHLGEGGQPGEQGQRGLLGLKGSRGTTGPLVISESSFWSFILAQGHTGPEGTMGRPGPKGEKGERGQDGAAEGPAGPQGVRGSVGDRGERGEPGDPGHAGQTGVDGERGITGPPGNHGNPGPKGRQGIKGQKGDQGQKGNSGPRGASGSKGQQGPDGDPGPRGAVGSEGLEGSTGEDGPPGQNGGRGIKGDAGDTGTLGFTGLTGLRGKGGSAGRPGIHGSTGPKGETGRPGESGRSGQTGSVGAVGLPGKQGANGAKGQSGDVGEHGYPGILGFFGPKGPRGDTGPKGIQGPKGPSGLRGMGGAAGPVGITGPSGQPVRNHGNHFLSGSPGPQGPPGAPVISFVNMFKYDKNRTNSDLLCQNYHDTERAMLDQSTDVLQTLQHLSTFLHSLKEPVGNRDSPVRICKDLHNCQRKMKDGSYWIDPNLGCNADAIEVTCNFTAGGQTCLNPVTASKLEMNVGRIQMNFIHLLSSEAVQHIIIHCLNMSVWSTGPSAQPSDVTFTTWTGQKIQAGDLLQPLVPRDDCGIKDGLWHQTHFIFKMDPHFLPIVHVSSAAETELSARFRLEVGPVCFL